MGFGTTLAGVTARLSTWLPLISAKPRVLARYAIPAAFAVFAFSVAAALVIVGVAVVVATRWGRLADAVRSPRAVLVGRVLAVAVVLIALPSAVVTVVDIAAREKRPASCPVHLEGTTT